MAILTKGLVRPNAEQLFGKDLISQANEQKKITSGAELIKEYSINDFPVDVVQFAERLGILIEYEYLDNDISGMLSQKDGKYVITVEKRHPINRQRFTIAHELAHYFLHKNLKEKFEDSIFFRGAESDTFEFQANLFAGELLMPSEEFLNQIKNGNSQIEGLAKYFGVSTLAIRVRAKQLDLQGHGL
jgi:hypothetical protein